MFFYILLILIIIVLFFISYRYPKNERIINLVLLSILVLVGALRDRIGWDYQSYTNWYLNGTRDDGFEFGFLGIMKVFRYLNLDYRFLFFFFSFLTYLFAYLGISRYTKRSSLPLVLYFLIPVLFLYSFTYIRQCLSVAIAFYAFSFLIDKKYFIYLLLMLIGCSIHYSCLIPFLVFPLVYRWGDSIKIRYLYILLGVSFIISQIGIIYWLNLLFRDSHYVYYVSHKSAVPVPFLKLLVMNFVGVLVISYFNRNGFEDKNLRFLLILYVCSIFILNLFSESIELTRIYIYFRIFEIILVSNIIFYALKNKRLWLISFICCFYLLPYYRAIKVDSEGKLNNDFKLIPYKSLLLKLH